jgi:putative transposase
MARQDDGMDVPDARRLREFEAENNKLKKLLAEAHLDIHALNTAFGVKRWPRRPSVPPSPP